ncbi:MAG: hypothetical protein M3209_20080 [Acidobacteriota bacterium]|nr:hypothetical protein [Acidobacteriota bacterium]
MKQLTEILEERFVHLHNRSCAFIQNVPLEKLYWQPREIRDLFPVSSCGEYILRSAGMVEQTFNGLTTKMWDDPFEWTLPEALFDNDKIIEYLGEVEKIRKRGFSLLASDADLLKEIPAPVRLKTIFELLLETLAQAENYQGRAFATFRFFSDEKLPR